MYDKKNMGGTSFWMGCFITLAICIGIYIVFIYRNPYNEFYTIENTVHVSPHSIRKQMDKGSIDSILVDLRSEEEYKEGHIITAVNIPAYKNKDESNYGDVERIIRAFTLLQDKHPHKDIIIYCYSQFCMTGRKVGKMLSDQGIYVKHLGIGRNEWKYDRRGRNHEHERKKTSPMNYITTGSLPGTLSGSTPNKSCPIDNTLGC